MNFKAEYIALGILFVAILVCIVLSTRQDVVKNNSNATNVTGLVRAAKQWLDASMRDTNQVAAILHVAYGAAYLHAARSMMSDEDIQMATGIEVEKLVTIFERQEKLVVERLNPQSTRVPPFRPRLNTAPRSTAVRK